MPHTKRFSTANDNAPKRAYPVAVNTRFSAATELVTETFATHVEFAQPSLAQNDAVAVKLKRNLLKPAAFIAAIIITCALLLGARALGLTVSDHIGILAGGSLALAAISKSRILLLCSIIGSCVWAALSFASPAVQSLLFFAFPAIWSMQIYLASRVKSRLAIIAGNVAGYYWLIGHGLAFMTTNAISPTMAISALFMAGVVHYRGGKAAEDEGVFGHETHTYFGWTFAAIGAVFISHYWLFPDNVLWQNMKASALGAVGWKVAIALGIAATGLAMMVRWKHYRVTALSAAALTTVCSLIPMTLWWETPLRRALDTAPAFSASPAIGLIIAAGTLTASLCLAFNGVRRNRIIMILAGVIASGVQALLLINPKLMTFENMTIFAVAMCLALGFVGLLAGSSFAQKRV